MISALWSKQRCLELSNGFVLRVQWFVTLFNLNICHIWLNSDLNLEILLNFNFCLLMINRDLIVSVTFISSYFDRLKGYYNCISHAEKNPIQFQTNPQLYRSRVV